MKIKGTHIIIALGIACLLGLITLSFQIHQLQNKIKVETHQQSVNLEMTRDSLIDDAYEKYKDFQNTLPTKELQELYIQVQCRRTEALNTMDELRNERARLEDDENYYTSGKKQYAEQCIMILSRAIQVFNTYIDCLENKDYSRLNSLNIKVDDILEELDKNQTLYDTGQYKKQPKRGYSIIK